MKVGIQNLQKIPRLASQLVSEQDCDVWLTQEINWPTEEKKSREKSYHVAHYTSQRGGYGTAIIGKKELSNVNLVRSPHAETGGFVVKKTTIATCEGIEFVSFHGYNGQPFKNVSKLLDHVRALTAGLETDSLAVFAGDFNTWTQSHLDAVQGELAKLGFQLSFSWPYPDRDIPLDHAFTRNVSVIKEATFYRNESDHGGAILELALE
jgi:endonuclease/exonuclease/phosphatase (EEP) superfamily protein YafD